VKHYEERDDQALSDLQAVDSAVVVYGVGGEDVDHHEVGVEHGANGGVLEELTFHEHQPEFLDKN